MLSHEDNLANVATVKQVDIWTEIVDFPSFLTQGLQGKLAYGFGVQACFNVDVHVRHVGSCNERQALLPVLRGEIASAGILLFSAHGSEREALVERLHIEAVPEQKV